MAAAALWGGWCRCPRKCLGSGVRFLSSHNLVPLRRGTYHIRRPSRELPVSRSYSSGNRKGFLSGLLDNIKQELAKNKEKKESIKKFRDEARKLEESDALQEARRKYKTIESETVRTSEVIKKKLGELSGTVKEVTVSGPPRSIGRGSGPSVGRDRAPRLGAICGLWEERAVPGAAAELVPGQGGTWPGGCGAVGGRRGKSRPGAVASGVRLRGAPRKEGRVTLAHVPCSLPLG